MMTLSIAALPALLIYFVLAGASVFGERRARRENERSRAACEQARRDGTQPPFPPERCGVSMTRIKAKAKAGTYKRRDLRAAAVGAMTTQDHPPPPKPAKKGKR